VVTRTILASRRQSLLPFVQLSLHALNDFLGVLAEAHDHNRSDDLALTVELRNSAAQLRAARNRSQIPHKHRRSGSGVVTHHRVLDVLDGLDIAAPADRKSVV